MVYPLGKTHISSSLTCHESSLRLPDLLCYNKAYSNSILHLTHTYWPQFIITKKKKKKKKKHKHIHMHTQVNRTITAKHIYLKSV